MKSIELISRTEIRFRAAQLLLLVVLLVLSNTAGLAQVTSVAADQAPPIPGAGHDYINLLSETVSPAFGSVNVRISVPVPPGREITVPFSFEYDSSGSLHFSAAGSGPTDNTGYLGRGGWSYVVPSIQVTETEAQVGPPPPQNCFSYDNFIFSDMQGTLHTLGLEVNPGQQEGCFIAGQTWPPQVTNSSDGFVSATTPLGNSSPPPPPSVTVFDLDGTVFSFAGGVSRYHPETSAGDNTLVYNAIPNSIETRNGNIVTIADNGNGAFQITDSLGRVALSTSGFGASGNTVMVSGLANPYTITWSKQTANFNYQSQLIFTPNHSSDAFCGAGGNQTFNNTQPEITNIALPNGQSYQFQYESTFGMVSKIIYPTGAYVRYQWGLNPTSTSSIAVAHWNQSSGGPPPNPSVDVCEYLFPTVALQHRYVSFDGTHEVLQQDFSYAATTWTTETSPYEQWTSKQTTVTTTDNVTGAVQKTVYNYSAALVPELGVIPPPETGTGVHPVTPVETQVQSQDGSGNALRTVAKTYGNPYLPPVDERTALDNGQTSEIQRCFVTAGFYGTGSLCPHQSGAVNLLTDTYETDYGNGSPGSVLRRKHTDYATFAVTPLGASIVDRPCRNITYDGGGNASAETDSLYDNGTAVCGAAGTPSVSAVSNLPSGSHDEAHYSATSTAPRGNATKVTHKCFIPSTTLTCSDAATANAFDETGQLVSATDPNLNVTQYSYTDDYTDTAPSSNTNAYLTKITHPQTNGVNHIEKFSYAFSDGQLTGETDQNNQQTSYSFNDSLRRLTEIDFADGGKTTYSYNDSSSPTITKTVTATPTPNIVTSTVYDGMGRVHKTVLSSDPGGADYQRTDYTGLGSPFKVWNTTRCDPDTSPNGCTGENTWGITKYAYDALNRTITVTHPDNTVLSTSYTGRATIVTGEGNGTYNVQSISQIDGLGRLASICEVSATTQSGSSNNKPTACNLDISGTGFLTTYHYDLLGNLTRVSAAGVNDRTAAYNSLSQLICTSNPEVSNAAACPNPDSGSYTAGTVRYGYDPNGNLTTKTAPEPNQTNPAVTVTTTYSFDALNRLFKRQYSDLTPTAHIDYDSSSELGVSGLLNTVGRKSGEYVTDGNGNKLAGAVFSYDAVGRIKINSQCTPQNCPSNGVFSLGYTYDLSGQMLSASNGEGVTISYGYDAGSHLTSTTSNLVDANHPATLLSNTSYGPVGLTQATLGNGLTESQGYHQRGWLQSRQIANPNGAPGTGSVTISGSLQSQHHPATAGTATVSIGGPGDQSGGDGSGGLIWDSGQVFIGVPNGTSGYTVPYGGGSPCCTQFIAQYLVNGINQGDSYVSATCQGGGCGTTIVLTARTTGSSTNYSLSAGSTYDNTSTCYDGNGNPITPCFTQPSFTATASGQTLTGGQDASTTYDSGSTTITVNNHPDSYSWSGSGTTAASIAQGLCNAINGDGGAFVNASTNGTPGQCPLGSTSVSLVSKLSGASTDYTLSASSSSSMSSFSTSTSGANLTGGTNLLTLYSFSLNFAPDGNIGSANDTVNGNWTYTYDDMSRLHTAVANTSTGCIESYDRFGNRWSQQPYGSGNSCSASSLSFTGNNTANNNRIDGFSYDAAGNVLSDSAGHTFSYDAENRITSVAGGGTGTYTYDAEGSRIRRVTSSGTLDYLYDLDGRAVTEVSESGSFIGWTRGEIYAGDQHLASYQNGTTYFDHTDWLNNERLRTNLNGTTYASWTNLPFGEGSSTPNPGPLHFTGKERDPESNLDDFGARYYSSALGRFLSTDDPLAGQDPADPQSWNLYSYARNNPIGHVDPDGHYPVATVCLINEQGKEDCFVILYWQIYQEATKAGANPGVVFPKLGQNGDITCGGVVCGHVSFLDNGAVEPEGESIVLGLGIGKAVGFVFGRIGGKIAGSIGRGVGRAAGDTAGETAGAAARTAAQAVFRTGGIIDRTVQTTAGPVRIIAQVDVEGTTVTIRDIAIYPTESEAPLSAGVSEMRQAIKPILSEAKEAGLTKAKIEYHRTGGISPGTDRTLTITLK